jgi:hypothetical protein
MIVPVLSDSAQAPAIRKKALYAHVTAV